jgi:uncharacterized protein
VGDKLIDAIQAGDVDAARELVEADPEVARSCDERGTSALLVALYHRQPEIADIIRCVVQPLNVHEAAALGDVGRLTALLDEDPAQAGAVADDGFFPLGLAAFFGRSGAVRLLLERGADIEQAAANEMRVRAVHAAAACRAAPIVRDLLAAGADPDSRQQQGYTPLMAAAHSGDLETLEVLLTSGADPSLTNDDGHTAHDLAVAAGHTDAAARLSRN